MGKNTLGICLLMILIGLIVLAYPEENNIMMIKLSETHGPSAPDIIGIIIIMAGYIPLVFKIFMSAEKLRRKLGVFFWFMHLFLILMAFSLIGLSVYRGTDTLLWVSVFFAVILQGILVYHSFKSV